MARSVSVRGIAALVVVLAVSSAHAEPDAASLLSNAHVAIGELRYDEALQLLDQAWRAGGSDRAQLAGLFSLAGQAAGSIGDDAAARLWFERFASLDAHVQLPPGTSPKLVALLADARGELAGATLTAHARRTDDTIELVIDSDPLALANAARLGTGRVVVHDRAATFAPADGPVSVLDRYGNVIATIAVTDVRVVPPPPATWYGRWPTWAVATGAFTAVGGAALWIAAGARSDLRTLDNNSTMHQYGDAHAVEERFDRAQWAARLAFGGAAISAAIGIWLWARGDHAPTHIRVSAEGVAWGLAF